ncbi:hypothetical protein BU14_0032s0073 [Porphyra umbilicalis]|uniref:Exportin-1/Importin-beta-like domain-containing protein n=1 Tax=Porphyra umbilicalis TaxID=2786 RepID=A0A1X6PJ22_PORUM|nr:hypothetical protein BU14_0032s0073 [Porphyra umbilicalis]|eukprot:OSX80815.1 hypothetical protein BU14_0032s0073 [Porphyra umbilicalis]
MLAFHLLGRVVLAPDRWDRLEPPAVGRVRSIALAAAAASAGAGGGGGGATAHLWASQAAALLAAVAVRTWPPAWPSLLPDWTGGALPAGVVCDALAALSDDVHGSEFAAGGGALAPGRRAELAAALADALPTVLAFVTGAAESFYAAGDARGMRSALSALRAYMRWAPPRALLDARAPAASVALLDDGALREAALGCLDALAGRREPPPSPFGGEALLLPLAAWAGRSGLLAGGGGGGRGAPMPTASACALWRSRRIWRPRTGTRRPGRGGSTRGGCPARGGARPTAAAQGGAGGGGGGGDAAAVTASRAALAFTFLPTAVAAFLPGPYADAEWFAVDDALREDAGDDSDEDEADEEGGGGGGGVDGAAASSGGGGSGGGGGVAAKLDRRGFRSALVHLRARSAGVLTSAASLAPAAAAVWVLSRLDELLAVVPTVAPGGFDATARPERLSDAAGAGGVPPVAADAATVAATVGVPPDVAAAGRVWRFDTGGAGGAPRARGDALLATLDGLLPAVEAVLSALSAAAVTPAVAGGAGGPRLCRAAARCANDADDAGGGGGGGGGGPGGGVGTDAPALAAVREARNRACHALAAICRRLTTAAPVAAAGAPPGAAVALTGGGESAAAGASAPNNLLPLVGPLCDHVASLLGTPAGAALYPGDKCVVLEAAVLASRLLVPPRAGPVTGAPAAPAAPPPSTAARDRVLVGLLTPALAALSGAAAALTTPQALLALSPADRDGLAAALLVADGGVHAAAALQPPPGVGGPARAALGAAATLLTALASLPAVDPLLALPTAREVAYLLNADVKGPAAAAAGGRSGGSAPPRRRPTRSRASAWRTLASASPAAPTATGPRRCGTRRWSARGGGRGVGGGGCRGGGVAPPPSGAAAGVADLLRVAREHARPLLGRAAAEMLVATLPLAEEAGGGGGGAATDAPGGASAAAVADPTATPHLDLYGGGGGWEPLTASVWALLRATVTAGDVTACRSALGVVTRLADEVAAPPRGPPATPPPPPPHPRSDAIAERLVSGLLPPVLLTAVALDGGGGETAADAAVSALFATLRVRPDAARGVLATAAAGEPPAVGAALAAAAAEAAADAARAVPSVSARRKARAGVRAAVRAVAGATALGSRPRAAVGALTSAGAERAAAREARRLRRDAERRGGVDVGGGGGGGGGVPAGGGGGGRQCAPPPAAARVGWGGGDDGGGGGGGGRRRQPGSISPLLERLYDG